MQPTGTAVQDNDTRHTATEGQPRQTVARRISWTCMHLMVATVPLAMTNLTWLPGISQPFTYDQFDLPKTVLLMIIMSVGFFSAAYDVLAGGAPVRMDRGAGIVLALVAWVTVTTAASIDPLTSLGGAYHRFEGLVAYLLYAGVYFLAMQHLDRISRVRSIARTLVLTSLPVSAYGIAQFAGADPAGWDVMGFESQRAASTFGNPEMLGGFLVIAVTVSLGLALTERDTRWRVTYWSAAALGASCLLVTFTRGAWAGGALATTILVVTSWRRGWRPGRLDSALAGLLVLGVITAGAISLNSPDATVNLGSRLASIFDPSSGSSLSRLQIWDAAARATLERPVLGSGPDTFGLIFPAYKSAEFVRTHGYRVVADRAHDYPLQLTATVGIPGALLFFGLCTMVALHSGRHALGVRPDDADSRNPLVFSALWAALAGYLLHLTFGISTPGVSFLLWLVLGALSSPCARSMQPRAGVWRVVALGTIGLAAAALVIASTLAAAADAHFMRAQAAGLYTERAAHADRAVVLNPLAEQYRLRRAALHVDAFIMLTGSAAEAERAGGDPSGSLAEAYAVFGRAQAATYHAIDSCPAQVENRLLLIRLYNTAGRHIGAQYYSKAVAAAEDAISLSPNSPEIRVQYAIALKNTGDEAETERQLLTAVGLDPAYADPLVLLGELYRLNGDATTALGYYERVKALDPAYPGIDELVEQMRTLSATPE